ncbi:MAG: hypothetical protein D5R97_10485 [Candidatus Syntrophonatronum acetioxidans]|uniref:Uncharacterized protein n=1 Tax=Candidatus Syntrophonatronum acetioxidans TaxID=1795816 RepID=A0A424Y932_9FIRM|nr:MAG: hypothetical protein D5R97_10485 [Candidatus Syntrophonatronum acetioxidans]
MINIIRIVLLSLLVLAMVAGFSSPVAAEYSENIGHSETIVHPEYPGFTTTYTIRGANITDVQYSEEHRQDPHPHLVPIIELSGKVREGDTITVELQATTPPGFPPPMDDEPLALLFTWLEQEDLPEDNLEYAEQTAYPYLDGSVEVTLSYEVSGREEVVLVGHNFAWVPTGIELHGNFEVMPAEVSAPREEPTPPIDPDLDEDIGEGPVAADYTETVVSHRRPELTLTYTISGAEITDVQHGDYTVELSGNVREGDTITIRVLATSPLVDTDSEVAGGMVWAEIGQGESWIDFPDEEVKKTYPLGGSAEVILSQKASGSRFVFCRLWNGLASGKNYWLGPGDVVPRIWGTFRVVPAGAGAGVQDNDQGLTIGPGIWGGIDKIPLPENAAQAAAGILIPGLIAIGLDLLGRRGGAAAPGTTYDSGEGWEYREGGSYTFDDGMEYRVVDGEFVPSRELADGERYINPAGDERIWVGGQPWMEEDWARQQATNDSYTEAHRQDWQDHLATRPQELQPETLERLQQMQRSAARQGMVSGQDDMVGRVGELINDLLDPGRIPDPDQIKQARRIIGGRITGELLGPDQLPVPQEPWWNDRDSWGQALSETALNVTTGTTSDGGTSWIGVGGRVGIGALTGGASEWAFTPASGLYRVRDAIDRGASGWSAVGEAALGAAWEEGIGRVISGAVRVGGGAIRGSSAASSGGSVLQGARRGGWQSLQRLGKEQIQQVSDLFSRQAWRATGERLGDNLVRGTNRITNILSGQESYTGPRSISEVGSNVSDAIYGRPQTPPLTATEQTRLNQFNEAVNSGDPKKIAQIYQDGGMNELSNLQKRGVISAESAQKANRILKTQVDESIRRGTRGAILDTQNATGVRVEEVIVADSGSSAKREITRLNTDADRTLIPRYNDNDLRKYAWRNNISIEEAYDDLSRRFTESHSSNVDKALRDRGLSAEAVDYKSYNRIGSSSGQTDSYGEGFTSARQAGSGTAEVTRVNADGSIGGTYKTSGQSAVDANQLNRAQYSTREVTDFPSSFTPDEVPSVVEQQVKSISKNIDDPLSVAKSLGRAEKAANVASQSLNDPDLVRAAGEIYENPGNMNNVLTEYGFTDAAGNPDPSVFTQKGSKAIFDYAESLK